MMQLKTPLNEKQVRALKVGDKVLVSGIIFTGRDQLHKYLTENILEKFQKKLKDGIIYHCGPIVKKADNQYKIIAAGPTTSIREEPYEADIIKNYKIRAIIGKGGMGSATSKALQEHGCVYLAAIGGLAALLAKRIKKVINVYFLEEFGMPEAMWEIAVEDFPSIVTMDSNGNSLHDKILKISEENFFNLK